MVNRYIEPGEYKRFEVEDVLSTGTSEEVAAAAIAIALCEPDPQWAQDKLTLLSNSPGSMIRGNALLGFGHLARRFGILDGPNIKHLIEAGVKDPDEYVRGQAWAAASDVTHFLGWSIAGFYWESE